MAFVCYLIFDGEPVPLPDSYEVELEDIESDAGGETEAGTIQRDVVRMGRVTIPVSFSVSGGWLKKFSLYKKKKYIEVDYFAPDILDRKQSRMFIESYKASLVKDTSYKSLWKVSFVLREF